MPTGTAAAPGEARASLSESRATGTTWLVVVIALAAAARLATPGATWLWYDELLSVAFALQPLDVLVGPLIPDPHPPLYYAQLKPWLLVSLSDRWIVLNSIGWSVASVALLFVFGRRNYGLRVAATAALLFALSPFAIGWAHEARMYAMLSFCALGAWCCHHSWFDPGGRRWHVFALGMLADLALVYSHLVGALMLSCVLCAAALHAAAVRSPRAAVGAWALGRVGVALAALPAAFRLLETRSASQSGNFAYVVVPGVSDLLQVLAEIFSGTQLGTGDELSSAALVLAGAFALLITVGGIAGARSRSLALGLFVLPILAALLLSHLVAPLWHVRALAFMAPFCALLVALIVWEGPAPRARDAALSLRGAAALLLVASQAFLSWQSPPAKNVDFKVAVEQLRPQIRSGDVVYVPHAFDAWAWSWYFIGPSRNRPFLRSGVEVSDGVGVITGKPDHDVMQGRRVWTVRTQWHVQTELPQHRREVRTQLDTIIVERWLPLPATAQAEETPN